MPYKLAFTSTASAGLGGKITVSGKVQDAFGNDLTTALDHGGFVFTQVGATAPANDATDFDYDTTSKVYTIKWTAPATAQPVAVQMSIAPAKAPTAVTAFGAAVPTQFFSVGVVDLATRVATLETQVATLQAQLANSRAKATSVTKKRYNTLARKWNAANPGARVALKK
jgi:hypothetical protein